MRKALLYFFQISLPEAQLSKSHKFVSPIVSSCRILQQLFAASESVIPTFLCIFSTLFSQFFEMYLLTIYFRELLYIFLRQSFGLALITPFPYIGLSAFRAGRRILFQSSDRVMDDSGGEAVGRTGSQVLQSIGDGEVSSTVGMLHQSTASMKDSISSLLDEDVINKQLAHQMKLITNPFAQPFPTGTTLTLN